MADDRVRRLMERMRHAIGEMRDAAVDLTRALDRITVQSSDLMTLLLDKHQTLEDRVEALEKEVGRDD